MKLRNLLLIAVTMLLMNSCEEDPLGLFGDDIRDGMVGKWTVEEKSSLFKKSVNTYQVSISKDNQDSSAIYIRNFYDLGTNVSVKVLMNNNFLSIPEQDVDGLIGTVSISGSGSAGWDYDKINLSYTVDLQNNDTDQVTAVLTPVK
jgi:hypothetical protein